MAKVIFGATKEPIIHQRLLEKVVRDLFVGEDIKTDVRKEGNILNPATGKYLELDIYIPKLKICFEFQDSYHYTTTWYSNSSLAQIKEIDFFKQKQVEDRGENLIYVPCWWDGTPESLVASIQRQRPDLLKDFVSSNISPIPDDPPTGFFQSGSVSGVGELMLASFPTDAAFYKSVSKENPWWLGEKYDGIRCCWNPSDAKVYRRSGFELVLPQKVYKLMANIFLDGEIWFGRGLYTGAVKLLKSTDSVDWPLFRFMIFDTPSPSIRDFAFEKRYEALLNNIGFHNQILIISYRTLCESQKQLEQNIQNIIQNGGEGAILRKPGSIYESGRSNSLLKLKAALGDKEAVVVRVNSNGSVVLKQPDDLEFVVKADNIKIDNQPVQGDVVTFSYEKLSRRDTPTNPKIIQIRNDVSWEEVLINHSRDSLNESSRRVVGFTAKPRNHWTKEQGKNMRLFFETFAKTQNFDPLIPDSWYSIPRQSVEVTMGGEAIMGHLRGGFARGLMRVFPEVNFDESKFSTYTLPNEYWGDPRNRRKVFDSYAASRSFDPLLTENWYSIKKSDFMSFQGASAALRRHRRQLIKALSDIYPELKWDPRKFLYLRPKGYWDNINNRKKFFYEFARVREFDPLLPTNWYNVSTAHFENTKGGNTLLRLYNCSFKKALLHLFPNIGLEDKKFIRKKLNRTP